MGQLSEQMAKDRGITRAKQDAFAAASYQKATAAQAAGLFDAEIAPLTVKFEDPKSGETKEIVVDRDDGVRPGTTAESSRLIAGSAFTLLAGRHVIILAKMRTPSARKGLREAGSSTSGKGGWMSGLK